MNNPKIFYLSTSLNIGGTEKNILTYISNLQSKYDFTVGFIKDRGVIGNELSKLNIPVIHFNFIWQLIRFLKKNTFNIVHTFLFRGNVIGRIAGKLAGSPVVISSQQAIDNWRKFYHVWADGMSAYFCDMIIANSQAAKDTLVKKENIQEDKIRVVYNGINFESFITSKSKETIKKELNLPNDSLIAVYVGRLHKEKGADFLPKISANLKYPCKFLIVGDGAERKGMENKIKKLKVSKNFIFMGWRDNIPELLKASDVFILPSREESFPQVILEAMSQSLPIVAMDVGGVKELVDHQQNGLLVKPGKIADFVSSLKYLLDKPEKRIEMGKNGYNKSLKFSESKMIEELDLIYQELLQKISIN